MPEEIVFYWHIYPVSDGETWYVKLTQDTNFTDACDS